MLKCQWKETPPTWHEHVQRFTEKSFRILLGDVLSFRTSRVSLTGDTVQMMVGK